MELMFILKFIFLTIFVSGIIIFILHRSLISGTEGALKNLDEQIAEANRRQAELNDKLTKADQELEKRKAEAKQLADKMRTDAEEESKTEREKIITKARAESEEIIAKAHATMAKIRLDLEKEADIKAVSMSLEILKNILSNKSKGALNDVLTKEFIEKLKTADMSKISPEVNTIEIISVEEINDAHKTQITQIVKEKLGRDVTVKIGTDTAVGGGVKLKFGTIALDGSLANLLREEATRLQTVVDTRK